MKKIFSYAIVLIGIFLFYQNTTAYAALGDTSEWNNYDDYVVIDHDTTWSGNLTHVELPHPVVIVNEAVLTIEPGTTIEINHLTLYNGRIEAIGTETAPIHFTKGPIDYSGVPADYAPYDRECYFYPEAGMIEFRSNWVDWDTVPSVFRNVIFEGMGTYGWYGSDNCPWHMSLEDSFRNFFMKTANASSLVFNPTLKLSTGRVQIEHSTFKNNAYADIETELIFNDNWGPYDSLEVTDSNFSGNTQQTAVIVGVNYDGNRDLSGQIVLKNNWYGTSNGPTTLRNPGGVGERIIGEMFTLDGWSATEFTSACTSNCYSNVMFLPGVEASRLYIDNNRVWEPGNDTDAEKLHLDGNGKSIRNDVYTKDVIDNAYVPAKGNIYKSFLEDLDAWKNTDNLIVDYTVAPYDWRLSLNDILNNGTKTGDNISYTDSTNTPYIIGELERLASTSKSGKVTLIAHSNGGLVAKALIQKLGDAEASRLIDKVVFVAVPQTGTPKAIGAILHGYDQGLPVDWWPFALTPQKARTLAQNMSSVYTLLPSDAYFRGEGSGVDTPVITFENGALTQPFINNYGNSITTSADLRSFLTNNTGKVSADSSDITSPSKVNFSLLADSKNTHETLDNLVIPSSISVYQIAGFGQETLGTIKYWTGEECLHEGGKICSSRVPKLEYTPELIADGDGTVVAPSALAMSTDATNISRWWVNSGQYNKEHAIEREHAGILEILGLRSFIKDNILTGISTVLPEFISNSQPPIASEKRLRYYLHSPLALSAHDSQGNVISAENETYPGAEYQRFGEVQYISLPAESHPTVVLDGQAEGSFTLEVQEVTNNAVTEKTTFSAIPTSPDTTVTMAFPDGTVTGASPLVVDYNGDGTTDFSLASKPGEIVVFDITSPVTTSSAVGTTRTNDWYTSDVTVTLIAQDEAGGTGVEKTEYSLDNGTHWNMYADTFVLSNEGTTTVQYFSTDKQGNREETKTQTVKIDKTAPEGKVVFNSTTQKLDVIGTDNLSQNVSVAVVDSVVPSSSVHSDDREGSKESDKKGSSEHEDDRDARAKSVVSITDEAGHVTILTLGTSKDKEHRIVRTLESISYDGVMTSLSKTSLQYKWNIEKKKNVYTMLASSMRVGSKTIESHYIPKKNITIIMQKPTDLDERDEDSDSETRPIKEKRPGMVIPSMVIEKGIVKINY